MATDVASKGLDFPMIQHVINYDMPDDIENYVHRSVLILGRAHLFKRGCVEIALAAESVKVNNGMSVRRIESVSRSGRLRIQTTFYT